MGLNADLSVISRTEFRKYPEVEFTPLATFDLYKDWVQLELVLRAMPKPLPLALRGNRNPLEEFDDDWDAYIVFVTPGLVKRVSRALGAVSDEDLIAALKAIGFARRKYEHKRYLAAFETLKLAYRSAAKNDAYLQIFIS